MINKLSKRVEDLSKQVKVNSVKTTLNSQGSGKASTQPYQRSPKRREGQFQNGVDSTKKARAQAQMSAESHGVESHIIPLPHNTHQQYQMSRSPPPPHYQRVPPSSPPPPPPTHYQHQMLQSPHSHQYGANHQHHQSPMNPHTEHSSQIQSQCFMSPYPSMMVQSPQMQSPQMQVNSNVNHVSENPPSSQHHRGHHYQQRRDWQ